MATLVAGKEVSQESRNRLETLKAQIVKVEAELAGYRSVQAAAESEIRASVRSAALAGDGEVVASDRSRRLAPLRDQVDDASDALAALQETLPEAEQAAALEKAEEAQARLAEVNGEAIEALQTFARAWGDMLDSLAEVDRLAREHNEILQSQYVPAWKIRHPEFQDRAPDDRERMARNDLVRAGYAFALNTKNLESTLRSVEFYGLAQSKFRAAPLDAGAFVQKWAKEGAEND